MNPHPDASGALDALASRPAAPLQLDAERPAAGARARLAGLVRLLHPFPSTLVALSVLAMGIVAARGAPAWDRLLTAAVAMWLTQFLVGITNDLADRALDGATKPWKPLSRRTVPPWLAGALAGGVAAAAALLVARLGRDAVLALAVTTAALLLYNVSLKRTTWSWTPFAIFFPLIPVYACAALGRPAPESGPLLVTGGLLGVGVHLANAAPDVEGDTRHGAAGLAGRLGMARAVRASWGLVAAAQVVALAAGIRYGFAIAPLTIGIAASSSLLLVARIAARSGAAGLQRNFALVCLSAMALGIGWVAGVAWR